MELNLRDLTRLCNVSERTIERWIKREHLPCSRIDGHYFFNRVDFLEWATSRWIGVPPRLFDNSKENSGRDVSLVTALRRGGIFYEVEDTSKEKALAAVIDAMRLPRSLDRQLLFDLFVAREQLGSTAIGDGIAIPHVRSPVVLRIAHPAVTLCFLQKPVDFGAADGKPVDALFALVSPTVRLHSQLLARLCYALHDADFKDAIRRHTDRREILQQVCRLEASLDQEHEA